MLQCERLDIRVVHGVPKAYLSGFVVKQICAILILCWTIVVSDGKG